MRNDIAGHVVGENSLSVRSPQDSHFNMGLLLCAERRSPQFVVDDEMEYVLLIPRVSSESAFEFDGVVASSRATVDHCFHARLGNNQIVRHGPVHLC
jgi:hypothetical protein